MKSDITIYLHSMALDLTYEFYDTDKIEWHLQRHERNELFEYILRMHYGEHIEKLIGDEHQAIVYEADARAAATAEDFNPF